MRDMTLVTNSHQVNGAANIPLIPLTPEQELSTRVRLSQALQMSLDTGEILNLFYKHIQPLVNVSGLVFKFSDDINVLKVGRECLHHCDYRLTTDEGYLGEIIFSRSKRFVEAELITLEFLLSSLIYPLRNSIRYQSAMRLALLDPLTMLGNRAALDTALRRELQMAERHHTSLSLLIIDVDFFKKINDEYGHNRGDMVLREIAKNIQSVCRGSDITFRYGGEEFVVVLGKTDSEGAKIIAERIRQQIAETAISHNGKIFNMTISIGIATYQGSTKEHINDFFERADNALYMAKKFGRNCVVSADAIAEANS
ncbi:GGDEF domain-containing protein [Cellvibrio sp. pealriver]|uniref:GGDEF domain-containing protein n=1 Tax=Cellvibrio sp. pealriver TaxID=1622269 RepID=UPI000ABF1F22|nr:GGDEF domain-containing protein [Cellvibrio sp. pealriver]